MAGPTSRWPAVTGLWLGAATWVYAALAARELARLDYDPTAPGRVGHDAVAEWVPPLVLATAVGLGVALLLSALSVVTGRLRRLADALLGAGLLAGAGMLWGVVEPRPVAPVLVGAAGVVLVVAAALPPRPTAGRAAGFGARLLLATPALLAGWVLAHELSEYSWRLESWSAPYYAGLVTAALLLLVAVLGERLTRRVWRVVLGVPLALAGLTALLLGAVFLSGGVLVSGFEEFEDGWRLGGPQSFLGAGVTAGAAALLRGRWSLACGTLGAAVLATLAMVFGIVEMRVGY